MNPENNTPEGTVPSQTTDTPRQPEATTTPDVAASITIHPVANPMSANEPQKPASADNAFSSGTTAASVKRKKLMKAMLIALVSIIAIVVVAVAVKIALGGGGVLGKLTADTYDGISFQRPEAWVMSEGDGISFQRPEAWVMSEDDGVVYYAEEGADIAKINNGIVLDKQAIGIDITSLDDDEKSQVTETLKRQFSEIGKASLASDTCSEPGDTSVEAVEVADYDLAFRVIVKCNNIININEGVTLNMLVGWHGSELQLLTVVATDSVMKNEAETLQKILDSVTPASQ